MTAIEKTLANVNWPLLAKQKAALLNACNSSASDELLIGLLYFVDAIQDAAELDGFPVVFLSDDGAVQS